MQEEASIEDAWIKHIFSIIEYNPDFIFFFFIKELSYLDLNVFNRAKAGNDHNPGYSYIA